MYFSPEEMNFLHSLAPSSRGKPNKNKKKRSENREGARLSESCTLSRRLLTMVSIWVLLNSSCQSKAESNRCFQKNSNIRFPYSWTSIGKLIVTCPHSVLSWIVSRREITSVTLLDIGLWASTLSLDFHSVVGLEGGSFAPSLSTMADSTI